MSYINGPFSHGAWRTPANSRLGQLFQTGGQSQGAGQYPGMTDPTLQEGQWPRMTAPARRPFPEMRAPTAPPMQSPAGGGYSAPLQSREPAAFGPWRQWQGFTPMWRYQQW